MGNYVINNPADLLEAAADEIEVNGWTRGTLVNEQGQMCMRGALVKASGQSPYLVMYNCYLNSPIQIDAENAVAAVIGTEFISTWNDRYCSSQAEAVDVLRRAAKHWWTENGK